jgi:predicted nucleotidyltransferase
MAEDRVPAETRRVVRAYRDRLADRFGADLLDVRIFGSAARGEATEHSDVDVLVLVARMTWHDKRQALDLAGDLWNETGLLLSPTVLALDDYRLWRAQERPLVMDIERDGIPP